MSLILPAAPAPPTAAHLPKVSAERQILFWSGALLVFCLTLWILGDILLPFVLGLAIGYMADPAADKLEAEGISRRMAALTIVGGFSAIFLAFVAIVGPILFDEASRFIENLPELVRKIREELTPWTRWLDRRIQQTTGSPPISEAIQSQLGNAGELGTAIGGQVLAGMKAGSAMLFQIGMVTVVTPIVAFFTIKEWDAMMQWLRDLLPRRQAATIEDMSNEIGTKLSGFVRGQIIVCGILAVFYGGALMIAGLNYGLLIGLAAGALSIIPLVGSTVGLLTGVIVAWFQTGEWTYVAMIAGIFAAGQFLEGNFLTPKIVGDRVGLHPLWILLAIMAGGALFSIVGMLIAVPVAIVVGVVASAAIRKYKASPFYKDITVLNPEHHDSTPPPGPSDPA